MFERIISIDWSGASTEERGVDLRVVVCDTLANTPRVVDRPNTGGRTIRSWSRAACRSWLKDRLAEEPRTLVAMDFGFGYPWGTDQAVLGVEGWHALVQEIRRRYENAGTARAAAQQINRDPRFEGHGPFRFNDSRNDHRFYVDHQVGYYRQAELLAPQAISQWYLGSGGTVGFHSISGLAAIGWLMEEREKGTVQFEVWPQEIWEPSGEKHLLVESYPSLCPAPADFGPCVDEHQRDAWKVLMFLRRELTANSLGTLFQVPSVRCGQIAGVEPRTQVQFEGFLLGLG